MWGPPRSKFCRAGISKPTVLLAVERTAYLHECAPGYNVPGIHGWFIAYQFARFLCFQEVMQRLDKLLLRGDAHAEHMP